MKPVLVLQHMTLDGPAFLATWLARHGIPMDLRNTEAGDPYPATLDGHAALAVLGGEMSANDPLPSLRQAEALIRLGLDRGVPVLGHCLGAQLMGRVMGGSVGPSPAPEIGWQDLQVHDDPAAHAWFGPAPAQRVFHWHGEAVTLPPGVTPLASSPACPVQAFGVGPHLAMQFHVEVDDEKLRRWAGARDARWAQLQTQHPTVHDGARMVADAVADLPAQHVLADRIYRRWWAVARAAAD